MDKLTPWEDVTGYNNYYEFGTGKDDPGCVKGWSMVVPWLGIPLGALIDRLEPTSKARYSDLVRRPKSLSFRTAASRSMFVP